MSKPHRFRTTHKRPRCAETGRIRYRDGKDAKLEIRSMQIMQAASKAMGRESHPVPDYSWKCPSCRGFHASHSRRLISAVAA